MLRYSLQDQEGPIGPVINPPSRPHPGSESITPPTPEGGSHDGSQMPTRHDGWEQGGSIDPENLPIPKPTPGRGN